MNIDEILDVGHQGSFEHGDYLPGAGRCIKCGYSATIGSWCDTHHPSVPDLPVHVDSRDRCLRCGRPLTDGVERSTGVCHRCRDWFLGGFDD